MKKLLSSLMLLAWLVVGVQTVKANEGRIVLESKGVRCEGVSVWRDGQYKIVGKCYGLQYPYKNEYDRYYLWVEDLKKETDVRVVEINRGYFEGFAFHKFKNVLVTAERESAPRRPSSYVVMDGDLKMFETPTGRQEVVVKSESLETNQETMTVQNQVKTGTAQMSTNTVGKVLGRIVLSLLIIVLVVIGMVIVGSLIFRKKGSVS